MTEKDIKNINYIINYYYSEIINIFENGIQNEKDLTFFQHFIKRYTTGEEDESLIKKYFSNLDVDNKLPKKVLSKITHINRNIKLRKTHIDALNEIKNSYFFKTEDDEDFVKSIFNNDILKDLFNNNFSFKDLFKKSTYIDKKTNIFEDIVIYDGYPLFNDDFYKTEYFKKIVKNQYLKTNKTIFFTLVSSNKVLLKYIYSKENNLFTDTQLADNITSYISKILTGNIRISDLSKLKSLRIFKDNINSEVLLRICSQLFKRYGADSTTTEIIFTMFLYYMNISLKDYPEVDLYFIANTGKMLNEEESN